MQRHVPACVVHELGAVLCMEGMKWSLPKGGVSAHSGIVPERHSVLLGLPFKLFDAFKEVGKASACEQISFGCIDRDGRGPTNNCPRLEICGNA